MRKAILFAALSVAIFAAAAGAVTLYSETATQAQAACRCPLIYAPVICDGGKVYSNQCVADCHHARNCVPYGAAVR